jgi:zinc protease
MKFFKKISFIITLFISLQTFAQNNQIVFEEDHSLPLVYINLVLKVGAAHDPQDKLGLTYLATQMLTRGTKSKNKLEFQSQLDNIGGKIEVDVKSDATVIRGAVLSENLNSFLNLLDEAIINPLFSNEELKKLIKETEGLILELKSSDKELVKYHFNKFLYKGHPYSNPIYGTRKGIHKCSLSDIKNFYKNYFGENTLKVFAVGDTKYEVLNDWFVNLNNKLKQVNPNAKLPNPIEKPSLARNKKALIVDKPNTTQTHYLLGAEGIRPSEPEFYPVQLANHAFGGGSFQARMMTELRVKRGWTYGAYNTFKFGANRAYYAMYVFPKLDDTIPSLKLLLNMFSDFIKNGITDDEFQFAKSSLTLNAPFNIDTAKKRIENITNETILNFPENYFKNFGKNIEKVEKKEVLPAIQKTFSLDNLTLVIVGDAKKLKEPLEKEFKEFAPVQVIPYTED